MATRPLIPNLTLFLRTTTNTSRQFIRTHSSTSTSSVSADELSHFSALASSWWDPVGPSRVLHLMNPLRHDFIASCLEDGSPISNSNSSSSRDNGDGTVGLKYLDVGCGGGIFAESLARTIPVSSSSSSSSSGTGGNATRTRAESIVAIDPSSTLIQIARNHARTDPIIDSHLRNNKVQYRNSTLEGLIALEDQNQRENKFDMITLFEVLEHIDPDPSPSTTTSSPMKFLMNCLRLLRPGGWLVGSTIARSLPSFLVNRVIAEAPWPIGVVPRGTHEWNKFVNPGELREWVERGLVGLDGDGGGGGDSGLDGMKWKCMGAMYFPGLGWKMIPGSEDWGNYFWAVRKGGRY